MGQRARMSEQDREELLERLEEKIEAFLEWLSVYSAEGEGVTRLLYTREWLQAQQALMGKLSDMGLDASFDEVGNVFGKLAGRKPELPPVLTGSHTDTVVNGGRYDGAYGIAAALVALDYLRETYGAPIRTLEAVALSEEEGSRFPLAYWGSGSITGERGFRDIVGLTDTEGISFEEAMNGCGFGDGCGRRARREDVGAFIELHIEQGSVLEREGISVGVVDAIVGQRRFQVTVAGVANHAGTTPMRMRRDALEGASAMIALLREEALRRGEPLVATVGRLSVQPNVPNVVPGLAAFTVDVRHADAAELASFCAWFEGRFREAAEARELGFECAEWFREEPAPMDETLKEQLDTVCGELGIASRRMVSGAGHDAQMFQRLCPSAMLFVPSRGGISHSPEEYTSPRELAAGVLVLTELLYRLGYEEEASNEEI
ncbi:M20 family metallo-hydrolase [Paenibacillus sp. LHD-117]|uniref:M20 family metallo-hydrolase n=1 Tax=Paenibacillus sp. LHD-117 TaxID=3071412 RepID=UPI0027E01B8D|nr:M20 family metallo-hydrolase [Paenibacillus sp. LHD-117]MDQ6418811.1 M20 family metallo-hydrolase [Paenibacillus sp. LHD-117]